MVKGVSDEERTRGTFWVVVTWVHPAEKFIELNVDDSVHFTVYTSQFS